LDFSDHLSKKVGEGRVKYVFLDLRQQLRWQTENKKETQGKDDRGELYNRAALAHAHIPEAINLKCNLA
jgi:hypothetical protein